MTLYLARSLRRSVTRKVRRGAIGKAETCEGSVKAKRPSRWLRQPGQSRGETGPRRARSVSIIQASLSGALFDLAQCGSHIVVNPPPVSNPGNNFPSAVLNHRNGLTHSFMIPEPELARRVFSPLAGLFAGPSQSQRSRLDPQRRMSCTGQRVVPSSEGVLYWLPLASRIDRRACKNERRG